MKSKLLILAVSAVLVACSPSGKVDTSYTVLPEGLKDCTIYVITNDSGNRLTVVRCPNSSTTTTHSSGKTSVTNIVVEK